MATTQELEQLLADLSLSRFLPKFKDEEIDDSCLDCLDEDDLKGLGLPLGPRTRFKQALSDRQASSRATSRAATPTPLEPAAEAFGGDDGLCIICMCDPVALRVDCAGKHEFCEECLMQWKREQVNKATKAMPCPSCRGDIRNVVSIATGEPVQPRAPVWGGAGAPKPPRTRAGAPPSAEHFPALDLTHAHPPGRRCQTRAARVRQ